MTMDYRILNLVVCCTIANALRLYCRNGEGFHNSKNSQCFKSDGNINLVNTRVPEY